MKAEQRTRTPAFVPRHNDNQRNQPGDASPGGVQTHCRGQAGPFLPERCFGGTAAARPRRPQFRRKCGEQQQHKSEQRHDLLLLLHHLSEPFGKALLPLPGRVGSPLPAVTCMQELSSVKSNCRPEKDNLSLHPSASLRSESGSVLEVSTP